MPVMPIYLKAVSYDSSGSARVRIFGSLSKYTVHYVRGSESSVNQQACPKSIKSEMTCGFCTKLEEANDSQISTYDRLMCIVWDFSTKRWSCLNGSEGLFREIKGLFNEKKFSKTEIVEGRTPDLILQRIGTKVTAALIDDSLGKTDNGIKKPIPTHGDLDRFMEKTATNSFWCSCSYPEALRALRRKRDQETHNMTLGVNFPIPIDSIEGRQILEGRRLEETSRPILRVPPATYDSLSFEAFARTRNPLNPRNLDNPMGLTPTPDGALNGALINYQRPVYSKPDEETDPEPIKPAKPKFKPDLPQRNTDPWDII